MSSSSTARVARYRERQREAGRRRLTLYIGSETQHKLDQLADGKAQAGLAEELLQAAIHREWAERVKPPPDGLQVSQTMKTAADAQMSVEADLMRFFPGRRRSLAGGRA